MARALAALREDLRSRTIRARQRMPLVAGTLAGLAGAALAVTALLPSNSQPGHPATARLTAWTVDSQANGNIRGVAQFHPGQNSAVLVLHPSALPDGAGLFIFDRPGLQPLPQAKAYSR